MNQVYGDIYLPKRNTVLCRDLLKKLGFPFGVDNFTHKLAGEVCAVIAYSELFSTEVRNYKEKQRRRRETIPYWRKRNPSLALP